MPKARTQLPKAPTGIQGLDEITGGGLPKGRPTLICGSASCGKTLLAMEFLVRGSSSNYFDNVRFRSRTEKLSPRRRPRNTTHILQIGGLSSMRGKPCFACGWKPHDEYHYADHSEKS